MRQRTHGVLASPMGGRWCGWHNRLCTTVFYATQSVAVYNAPGYDIGLFLSNPCCIGLCSHHLQSHVAGPIVGLLHALDLLLRCHYLKPSVFKLVLALLARCPYLVLLSCAMLCYADCCWQW